MQQAGTVRPRGRVCVWIAHSACSISDLFHSECDHINVPPNHLMVPAVKHLEPLELLFSRVGVSVLNK